jgi:hypothetical protein
MKIDHRIWELPSYPFGLNKATSFNEFVEGIADTFILNYKPRISCHYRYLPINYNFTIKSTPGFVLFITG